MEINSVAVLLVGILMLMVTGPHMYARLTGLMDHLFGRVHEYTLNVAQIQTLLMDVLVVSAWIILPLAFSIMIAGVLINFAQVGAMFTTKVLQPKLNKLDPIKGAKKFVSAKSFVEMFKSIGKLLLVALIGYLTIRGKMPAILTSGGLSEAGIGKFTLALAFEIFIKTCLALLILALLDLVFQQWKFKQDMKMTKHEVKEERKMMEGDPQVKSRIRSVQTEAARKRMMGSVPEADVVVTNPTHFAVALLYDPQKADAPMVVAKGKNILAARIREVATEHNVPLYEDQPLAQALYKQVEVGETIPFLFYEAVAEVLAYVYRLKGKKVNGG
jgi:flagellar biosynthetic protein FlhB